MLITTREEGGARMTGLRVLGTAVAAMALGVVSLPAQGAEPGLPFERTSTSESCGFAAQAADANSCTVKGRGSVATGAVSAATHLVSPAGGTAPWSAEA